MTRLRPLAASRLGSATLFGAAMFLAALVEEGLDAAMSVGALSALSWTALHPLLEKAVAGRIDAR